jgi:hypothetical protein
MGLGVAVWDLVDQQFDRDVGGDLVAVANQ